MHFINSSFILLIVLQYIALDQCSEFPDVMKSQAKKLHELCQKQHSVSKETIEQSILGELSTDANFKCYLHCLFDKVGLIDDKNIIHLEHLNEVLPEDLHNIINGLVEKCGTKAGSDGCNTAYKTVKCYKEAKPALFAEISAIIV